MTDKVKTEARVLERSNAKRPPTVATEAVAEDEEDCGNAAHIAAVAAATTAVTMAAAHATHCGVPGAASHASSRLACALMPMRPVQAALRAPPLAC